MPILPEEIAAIVSPATLEIYRQLGEISAEIRNRRDAEVEIKEALENIRSRLHDIANSLSPMPLFLDRIRKLETKSDEMHDMMARQGGMNKGLAIGLALGGGSFGAVAAKFLDMFLAAH